MTPGPWQIIIIILVVMLLFGAGKLPRMMEDVAKGIKSFKKGLKDEDASSSSEKVSAIPDKKHTDESDIIDATAETVEDTDKSASKK